jgi:hypothetical protein
MRFLCLSALVLWLCGEVSVPSLILADHKRGMLIVLSLGGNHNSSAVCERQDVNLSTTVIVLNLSSSCLGVV